MTTTQRGSSIVGLAVMTPVMVLLLLLVVAAGRLGVIESKLTTAARSAARAASQQRSEVAARTAATTTAESTLHRLSTGCPGGPEVLVREMDLRPGGQVDIEVLCSVSLSDLVPLNVPASRTVSAAASAVVDRYRSTLP
ncbi:TadE/TadG family type IV pilus assembly protein [Candidatus Poriferisocius sp.]|uniref:TadE/TadG family type IV pilus assembly protein n=1 Tax=Candidatus Poriferisocius sp. TaxID=3101276 RepID=UPI003B5C22E5